MTQPVFPSKALFTRSGCNVSVNFHSSEEMREFIQEFAGKYAILLTDGQEVTVNEWVSIILSYYDNASVKADCERLKSIETMTVAVFDGDITLDSRKRSDHLCAGINFDDAETFANESVEKLVSGLGVGSYTVALYVAEGGELCSGPLTV